MKEVKLSRSFVYNGITLIDPNLALSPDAVREFYSTQYPELNTAVVDGPVTKDNVSTYTIRRAAGAKGRGPVPMESRMKLKAIAAGQVSDSKQAQIDAGMAMKMKGATNVLQNLVTSREYSRPLQLPSGAFGIWG